MVTLTRDAVGRVARALMTLNGKTTTLEVKDALRKLGFWATQGQVREFMLDITSKDGDVQYKDDTGIFRTYMFTVPFPNSTPVAKPKPRVVYGFDGHEITEKDFCVNCSCSVKAIKHFNWKCKPKSDTVTQQFLAQSDAIVKASDFIHSIQQKQTDKVKYDRGVMAAGNTTVPYVDVSLKTSTASVEFGDYEVTDMWGKNRRVYRQVNRGVAKNKWVREVNNSLGYNYTFFDARARKI